MALNHLVLPLYQPSSEGNIYRWLKWTRRSLIFAIILAGYGFYLLLGAEQDLSNLGIVAFVATLQFLPGVLSVLYWPTANRRGYIAGLLAGIGVWMVTMLLPLVGNLDGFYIPLLNVVCWTTPAGIWRRSLAGGQRAGLLAVLDLQRDQPRGTERRRGLRGGKRAPAAAA